MDDLNNPKEISVEERVQINRQVKEDLINHLYQGCLPGTITGVVVSAVLFLDYYGHAPTNLLVGWLVFLTR